MYARIGFTSRKAEKGDIYFLSDTILRDKRHQITSVISDEFIEEQFNVKQESYYRYSSLSKTITTGFNSHWKSHVPHVSAIEKGSCIGINGARKLSVINKSQIGDRQEEGFGRIYIDPLFLDAKKIIILNDDNIINDSIKHQAEFKDLIFLKNLIKKIKSYKTEEQIKKIVINQLKDNKTNLNNSETRIILDLFDMYIRIGNIEVFNGFIKNSHILSENEFRNMKNDNILKHRVLIEGSTIEGIINEIINNDLDEIKRKLVRMNKMLKIDIENNLYNENEIKLLYIKINREIIYYKYRS